MPYQKVNSTGANLPCLIRPINQWRPIDQLTTFTSRQATLRDNLNRLPFPTGSSHDRKRLPRGRFPWLSLLGVSTFQVCFCQIQISIKRDKQRLSPDRFNVNSNEFLISADAIVSDTGAQRSVQLMLRWDVTTWSWGVIWEVFQIDESCAHPTALITAQFSDLEWLCDHRAVKNTTSCYEVARKPSCSKLSFLVAGWNHQFQKIGKAEFEIDRSNRFVMMKCEICSSSLQIASTVFEKTFSKRRKIRFLWVLQWSVKNCRADSNENELDGLISWDGHCVELASQSHRQFSRNLCSSRQKWVLQRVFHRNLWTDRPFPSLQKMRCLVVLQHVGWITFWAKT